MPQGEPISHADLMKALRFAIQLAEAEGFPACATGLRVALDRLTRPDTQADLTKQARALVEEFRAYLCNLMIDLDEPEIEWMTDKLAAALQSEREAALMDGGEWRTKLAEQIGKTQAAAAALTAMTQNRDERAAKVKMLRGRLDKARDQRQFLEIKLETAEAATAEALRTPFTKALIAKAREDAVAEARRAPDIFAAIRHHINTCMDQFELWKLKDSYGGTVYVSLSYDPGDRPEEAFDDLDAIASPPAPQEEAR